MKTCHYLLSLNPRLDLVRPAQDDRERGSQTSAPKQLKHSPRTTLTLRFAPGGFGTDVGVILSPIRCRVGLVCASL